jgi:Leucine-rich repeat (LRR) protein
MEKEISLIEKERIDKICKSYELRNYTINRDGSVDVSGNVIFGNRNLERIPLQFRHVSGFFLCNGNKLTSLEGCPITVGKGFSCEHNFLKSLEGCPKEVGLFCHCSNNFLTTPMYSPKKTHSLDLHHNMLISLIGLTGNITDQLLLHKNNLPKIFTNAFYNLSVNDQNIFIKYQSYYGIWTPELDEQAMDDLITEIKDGLL